MMEEADTNVFTHLFPKMIYALPDTKPLTLSNLEKITVQSPKLLLLFKNSYHQSIPENDLELLKKMVDWMGVQRSDVAFFLISNEPVSFMDLRNNHQIENIICYGVTPTDIGLQLEFGINKPVRFMNCNLIFTAPFDEVQKKEPLKKEFFDRVSKLFSHLNQKKQ